MSNVKDSTEDLKKRIEGLENINKIILNENKVLSEKYVKYEKKEVEDKINKIKGEYNANTQEDFIELRNSLIFKLLHLSVITENANNIQITPAFMSTLKTCTNKIFETYDKMCKIDVGVTNEER